VRRAFIGFAKDLQQPLTVDSSTKAMDSNSKAPQWDITSAIDDSLAEKQTYVVFEQHKQFVETQAALLSVDLFEQPPIDRERDEYRMLKYLEGIVSPVSRSQGIHLQERV
jgi:hypothetical protein